MDKGIKSNIVSLIVTGALVIVSVAIFVIFVNSDNAKNGDIDISKADSKQNKAVYYSVSGNEFKKITSKATGDFGKNFSDIKIKGELNDSNGNIDFTMENGKIGASYVTQSNAPNTYSYDSLSYEKDKKYSVDSEAYDADGFYGYVYYSSTDNSSDNKEKCKYLESSSYFSMVMCEDSENVYTTINTARENKDNKIQNIKNNAIYKFDKGSKQTKKIADFNIHTEGKFIEGIACNDQYIFVLINESEKYSISIIKKDTYEEKKSVDIDIFVNMDSLGNKLTKEFSNDVRKISNYEVQDNGYTLFASDNGLVVIKKCIIAEIDSSDPKHYGEKGYSNVYEQKKIEPYVKEVYAVSSFSIDGSEVKLDNTHVCVTSYIYNYVMYKNGLTYILTNVYGSDSDVLEKVKVTSLSNGKIFEEIFINLNKISNTSGSKNLKYLQIK